MLIASRLKVTATLDVIKVFAITRPRASRASACAQRVAEGTRDYVELRCNGRTVRIIDESEYLAESKQRILRKKRINRMRSYEQMYREICRRISLGIQGDSIASAKGAAAIGLRLQDSLDELIKSNDQVLGQRSRIRG
jgi:hypothetical protein